MIREANYDVINVENLCIIFDCERKEIALELADNGVIIEEMKVSKVSIYLRFLLEIWIEKRKIYIVFRIFAFFLEPVVESTFGD